MCVVCAFDNFGDNKLVVRGYWGKWYNFVPPKYRLWELLRKSPYDLSREKDKYWYWDRWYRPWRGEGNPAPWFMIIKPTVFRFSVALQRSRPWFKPEHGYKPASEWLGIGPGETKATKTGCVSPARSFLFWGIFSFVWAPANGVRT